MPMITWKNSSSIFHTSSPYPLPSGFGSDWQLQKKALSHSYLKVRPFVHTIALLPQCTGFYREYSKTPVDEFRRSRKLKQPDNHYSSMHKNLRLS
jgi:hypothetical protein